MAMGDGDLRALLAAEYQGALSATDASKLSGDRSDAMQYYLGDMSKDMPAPTGRSQAVSMDVQDTVEGMMPQLMEFFIGGDEVVRFEPVGPDDVQAAQQETDYVNHVFMNQNPGFTTLYQFIKDAFLQKVGIVKVWWEKQDREERETYYDKTDDEFALIVSNPDVEVIEHTAHPVEEADQGGSLPGVSPEAISQLAPQLHDVTVQIKKSHAQARVMGVPPEEFGFRRDTRVMKDCNYCYHKTPRSVDELIALGYDPEQVKSLPTFRGWASIEETVRDTVEESRGPGGDFNKDSRTVEIVEHYIRMDYKGDGQACLYRVTTGGSGGESKILIRDDEPDIIEFDAIPFAVASPIMQPHRLVGRSVADLVMDVQRIKTALMRGLLDNVYHINNFRTEVSESHISDNTLDDLLVSRPGGIVRTKQPGGLNVLQVQPVGQAVYPALEYMDSVKEWRTGVTPQSQGIDANALQSSSAIAVSQTFSASQARIRLVGRLLAEGVRDIFWLVHATTKKHADKVSVARLRNQWVTVDPRNWKTRNDLTVNVGLGTGSKAEQMGLLMQVLTAQKELLMGGKSNIVQDHNIYNSLKDLTRLVGKPDTESYFSDPQKTGPAPPPPPDPKIMEIQLKAQLEDKKAQTDAIHQQTKMQAEAVLEQQKFEHQKEIAYIQAQLDIAEQAHKQKMAEKDHQLKMREMAHKATPNVSINVDHENIGHIKGVLENLHEAHKAALSHNEELSGHNQHLQNTVAHMTAEHQAPVEFHRDQHGKIARVKKGSRIFNVQRDHNNRVVGLQ